MKIKLHEIELGVLDPNQNKTIFDDLLGLKLNVNRESLKVFDSGIPGLDLNFSTHLNAGKICISFLCDDLQYFMDALIRNGVAFSPPEKSHLGMLSISFTDGNGFIFKINAVTKDSPEWLKV